MSPATQRSGGNADTTAVVGMRRREASRKKRRQRKAIAFAETKVTEESSHDNDAVDSSALVTENNQGDLGKGNMSNKKEKSYYLIHTQNFFSQYLYWLTINVVLVQVVQTNPLLKEYSNIIYDYVLYKAMSFSQEIGAWVVISLLSSSCCAFQLILNFFSVGCAGLNSILGPMRPFFVSVVTISQAWQFIAIEKLEQYPRAYASLFVTFVLTFLPEMLYLWIQYKDYKMLQLEKRRDGSNPDETKMTPEYKVKIQGMNCIACVQTIKNTIESTKGVVGRSTVVLESGEAYVKMADWKSTAPLLTARINSIGFEANADEVEEVSLPSTSPRDEVTPAPTLSNPLLSFTTSILAGLLGSSCCILQLGLNVLSVFDIVHIGCAGFNVILGPLRPYLRALTIGWLLFLWGHVVASNKNSRSSVKKDANNKSSAEKLKNGSRKTCSRANTRLLMNTFVTLSLMYMPEGLKLLGGPAIAPPTADAVKQTYVVDNMGCEACIDAVQRIINRADGVLYSSIELQTGEATLWVAKDWNFNSEKLDQHLRHHGYELHEEGHITKKMKLDESLGVKKSLHKSASSGQTTGTSGFH